MALTPRRIRALVFLRDKEERVFPRNHAATTVSHVQHLVVVVACVVTGPNVLHVCAPTINRRRRHAFDRQFCDIWSRSPQVCFNRSHTFGVYFYFLKHALLCPCKDTFVDSNVHFFVFFSERVGIKSTVLVFSHRPFNCGYVADALNKYFRRAPSWKKRLLTCN